MSTSKEFLIGLGELVFSLTVFVFICLAVMTYFNSPLLAIILGAEAIIFLSEIIPRVTGITLSRRKGIKKVEKNFNGFWKEIFTLHLMFYGLMILVQIINSYFFR